MKCFKRIFVLIIAEVVGITYICSSVPVYAWNEDGSSYYTESSGDVPIVGSRITVKQGVVIETVTSGAVMETTSPDETNEPVVTPLVKETIVPVCTQEVNKTASPITAIPPITDMPISTNLPSGETPGNTDNIVVTQQPSISVGEEYCRISYQLNGGTNHKKNPTKVKKKGENVILNAPSRAKYTFVGWYTDAKYTQKVTTVGNTSLSFITLYAKWKKVTVNQAVLSYAKKKGTYSILVKVKKESGVAGFEYVYAKDLYFKRKYRLRTQKNPKTLSKLTKKQTYYIKVRAYKLDSTGKKIYGIYSRVKKVKL